MGLQRSLWRRKRQPTPVCLPGIIPWTEEPGGLQAVGSQRVGHDWVTGQSSLTDAIMCPFAESSVTESCGREAPGSRSQPIMSQQALKDWRKDAERMELDSLTLSEERKKRSITWRPLQVEPKKKGYKWTYKKKKSKKKTNELTKQRLRDLENELRVVWGALQGRPVREFGMDIHTLLCFI